jgi:hypothetical protein
MATRVVDVGHDEVAQLGRRQRQVRAHRLHVAGEQSQRLVAARDQPQRRVLHMGHQRRERIARNDETLGGLSMRMGHAGRFRMHDHGGIAGAQ